MADLPGYVIACLHSGRLAFLAIMVSAGIVLQILACALFNNWWPMLTGSTYFAFRCEISKVCYGNGLIVFAAVLMYVLLPMPLFFFMGSDSSSLFSSGGDSWVNATKFLTGASAVGSIAIPAILKHANVIGWGALALELSSFFVFVFSIICYLQMNRDSDYSPL